VGVRIRVTPLCAGAPGRIIDVAANHTNGRLAPLTITLPGSDRREEEMFREDQQAGHEGVLSRWRERWRAGRRESRAAR
jgi:hypothetical protein